MVVRYLTVFRLLVYGYDLLRVVRLCLVVVGGRACGGSECVHVAVRIEV